MGQLALVAFPVAVLAVLGMAVVAWRMMRTTGLEQVEHGLEHARVRSAEHGRGDDERVGTLQGAQRGIQVGFAQTADGLARGGDGDVTHLHDAHLDVVDAALAQLRGGSVEHEPHHGRGAGGRPHAARESDQSHRVLPSVVLLLVPLVTVLVLVLAARTLPSRRARVRALPIIG